MRITHKLVILILLCAAAPIGVATQRTCSPANQELRAGPSEAKYFPHGLYWQIAKPGTEASYIFGTIHLDIPRVTRLPPRANLAFAQAATLITEVELDKAAHDYYATAIVLRKPHTLSERLGHKDFERLSNIAKEYGVDAASLNRFKPWAVTNLIARPRAQTGVVLDEVLQQRARDWHKPIVALESMRELVHRLDSMSSADQLAILRDTICQHATLAAEATSLLSAYVDEDLARISAANSGPHDDEALARRFQDLMLWQRSRLMSVRLQKYLQRGNAFIAVGALHLPGERGLLHLLEQQGYTVTAMAP